MTRLSHLTVGDLPADDRDLLARPIALNRALAHSPRALRAYVTMAEWSRTEVALPARLRELAIICVGVCNRSPYIFSHHVRIGAEHGVTPADVAAVVAFVQGADVALAAEEQAALAACRELSTSGALSDRTWHELQDALGMPSCLDLVVLAGYYNMASRVVAALDVDVEEDYAPFLEQYPWAPEEEAS